MLYKFHIYIFDPPCWSLQITLFSEETEGEIFKYIYALTSFLFPFSLAAVMDPGL